MEKGEERERGKWAGRDRKERGGKGKERRVWELINLVYACGCEMIWIGALEAKFHYTCWFEAGSKLQRAEIWPII